MPTTTVVDSGLGTAILAASVNNKDVEMVAAQGIAEIRHDIGEAESDVKEAIQVQTAQRVVETLNLHDRICETEKSAIEAKYEGRLETLRGVKEVKEEIDHFKEEVFEEFCDFRRDMHDKFANLRNEKLEDEVDALRAKAQNASIVEQVLAALGK